LCLKGFGQLNGILSNALLYIKKIMPYFAENLRDIKHL